MPSYQSPQSLSARTDSDSALHESEARKEAILAGALDCIITMDDNQRIVEWNPAAERTFGHSRVWAIGQLLPDLIIPPPLRAAHAAGFAHYMASGEGPILNKRIEVPAFHADGTEFPAELTVIPIKLHERTLFTAYLRDITERKSAEQKLRESEARYRTLVSATAQIVWTNTAEGRMNAANVDWGLFTGQSEAEYLGYGWANAVHPDDVPPTLAEWNICVEARSPFVFEHRVRRFDGEYRSFSIRAVPVLETNGSIREWIGIHTDITERKSAEALERDANMRQRAFLRDVLASVTESKLLLVDDPAQLPPLLTPVGEPIALSHKDGLREVRQRAREAAHAAGHTAEREYDLVTAASEAGMNAITHGGGSGMAQIFSSETGKVQVRVDDHGTGIAMENLPRATLARGFSTQATLGHGLKMILETIDRLYLLTGPGGTTVILEQDRDPALPIWLSEAVQ